MELAFTVFLWVIATLQFYGSCLYWREGKTAEGFTNFVVFVFLVMGLIFVGVGA